MDEKAEYKGGGNCTQMGTFRGNLLEKVTSSAAHLNLSIVWVLTELWYILCKSVKQLNLNLTSMISCFERKYMNIQNKIRVKKLVWSLWFLKGSVKKLKLILASQKC